MAERKAGIQVKVMLFLNCSDLMVYLMTMCPKWGMSFFIIWMQLNDKTFFTEFIQEVYSDG